jgi:hypothetical protein
MDNLDGFQKLVSTRWTFSILISIGLERRDPQSWSRLVSNVETPRVTFCLFKNFLFFAILSVDYVCVMSLASRDLFPFIFITTIKSTFLSQVLSLIIYLCLRWRNFLRYLLTILLKVVFNTFQEQLPENCERIDGQQVHMPQFVSALPASASTPSWCSQA